MRNALVVLVSFYTSLSSGFIVPSSVPEFLDEESAILAENNVTKMDEMKVSTVDAEFVALPTNHDGDNKVNILDNTGSIDENALYEHVSEKTNNLNERSFLYINQRFKTPIRDRLYDSHFQVLNMPVKNMKDAGLYRFNKFPSRHSAALFQPSIDEYINTNIEYSEYNNQCDDNKKIQDLKDTYTTKGNYNKKAKLPTANRGPEDQRSYLELLRPPLLRPVNHNDHKLNSENTNNIDLFLPTAEFSKHHFGLNKNYPKVQTSFNVDQKSIKDANDLSRLYTLQKPFVDNHIKSKADNRNFKNHLVTDEVQSTLDEKTDEEKLDRYLKGTYREKITNEAINVNYNDCNYRDCVIAGDEQKTKNKKTDCKCGHKLNLRDENSNIHRERLERDEMTYKTTGTPKSSEINDYEEILVEERSVKSGDDELMKTINKLNDTLQMYYSRV